MIRKIIDARVIGNLAVRGSGHRLLRPLANEDGFVLIAAIVILFILVILGMSTTTTTNIELQIAGNDKVAKQAFYQADGGTQLGGRMVEENVGCPNGFTANQIGSSITVVPTRLAFWQTTPGDLTNNTLVSPDFGDANNDGTDDDGDGLDDRAFYYTPDAGRTTNVIVAGTTQYAAGSSIQMTAGYEGKGKGAAAGGSSINYNIIAQGVGALNSISEVEIIWGHVIGQEGECNY